MPAKYCDIPIFSLEHEKGASWVNFAQGSSIEIDTAKDILSYVDQKDTHTWEMPIYPLNLEL